MCSRNWCVQRSVTYRVCRVHASSPAACLSGDGVDRHASHASPAPPSGLWHGAPPRGPLLAVLVATGFP
jgi:hypothetical protein